MPEPLWTPSIERIRRANLVRFVAQGQGRWRSGDQMNVDYAQLYEWSISEPAEFWQSMWEFAGIRASLRDGPVVVDLDRMPGARFFPNVRLNVAENLMFRSSGQEPAIIFRSENGTTRTMSWHVLHEEVAGFAGALRALRIRPGDRVAGFVPNTPEAVIAALGSAAIGAVWSSCSPDFGVQGVIDRFGQIEPRVLVGADEYFYGGKRFDCTAKLKDIVARLPSVERTVVSSYSGAGTQWEEFVGPHRNPGLQFEQLPFDHPLYILYSSGTTGVPKCIVHGAGGTLIQHLKEHQLHCDIHPGDRVFYFTTCGWMMWNWLVSALASEATLLQYDGSRFILTATCCSTSPTKPA